jgi:hypothetical protein
MNYSGLAVILLRCSGVISIVVGGFHLAAYVPMIWDVSPSARGGMGVIRTILLPQLAGVVGGLVLFLSARVLGRLVARGVE